jgi:hypothetical protein
MSSMNRDLYLHVYKAPSGQWSAKVLETVAAIAGCESPEEAIEAAREQFPDIAFLPGDSSVVANSQQQTAE